MRQGKRRTERDLINRLGSASTIRSVLIETAWSHLPPLKDEPYQIPHNNLPLHYKIYFGLTYSTAASLLCLDADWE